MKTNYLKPKIVSQGNLMWHEKMPKTWCVGLDPKIVLFVAEGTFWVLAGGTIVD